MKKLKVWDDIDEGTQDDLIEWYNHGEVTRADKRRLAELYHSGQFASWECPHCSDKILVGRPDNWDHFQGVWQSDYVGQLCSDCGALYLRLKEQSGE